MLPRRIEQHARVRLSVRVRVVEGGAFVDVVQRQLFRRKVSLQLGMDSVQIVLRHSPARNARLIRHNHGLIAARQHQAQ